MLTRPYTDSFGLPKPLQTWLFPADGSTRDFTTLQVILGRNDEYFASDSKGKISSHTKSNDEEKAESGSMTSPQSGSPRLVRKLSNPPPLSRTRSMSPGGSSYIPGQPFQLQRSRTERFGSNPPPPVPRIAPIANNGPSLYQQQGQQPDSPRNNGTSRFPLGHRSTGSGVSNSPPLPIMSQPGEGSRAMPRFFSSNRPPTRPAASNIPNQSGLANVPPSTVANTSFGPGSANTPYSRGPSRLSIDNTQQQRMAQEPAPALPPPQSPVKQKTRPRNVYFDPSTRMMTPEHSPERFQNSAGTSDKSVQFASQPRNTSSKPQMDEEVKPRARMEHSSQNPTYADASTQTDKPPRKSRSTGTQRHAEHLRAKIEVVQDHIAVPMALGSMMDYFRSPSYQLGDALNMGRYNSRFRDYH